jgi:hypothetical protein
MIFNLLMEYNILIQMKICSIAKQATVVTQRGLDLN